MLETQLFNIHKFDRFGSDPLKSDKVTVLAGSNHVSSQSASSPVNSLAYSHNNQIMCVSLANVNQYLVLAKASDGMVISKQDTFLTQFIQPSQAHSTRIVHATFTSADSSKIAYVTSEGSMQSRFGGHLVVLDMLRKQLDRVYKEPFLSCGGVSFNTNDSMIVTGNVNGEVIVRNLNSKEGMPSSRDIDKTDGHDQGTSQAVLSHFTKGSDAGCEVTQVKFSVVKRYIMASAYKNGQVVIWDTQGIFTKGPHGISQSCRKFVFNAHGGQPCSGIAFSQVNHLLLTSCGVDGKIHFYDITMGKEVKKIDINQNSSSSQAANQQITLSQGEYMTQIQFCIDGCTIAVGTNAGRIVVYNLKDVKKSKSQIQYQTGKGISALAFQRPLKPSSSSSKAPSQAAPSQSQMSHSAIEQQNQSIASISTLNDQAPAASNSSRVARKSAAGPSSRMAPPASIPKPDKHGKSFVVGERPTASMQPSAVGPSLSKHSSSVLTPSDKNANAAQESFKLKLNELKMQTAQMINRGDQQPKVQTNNENREVPMEIDDDRNLRKQASTNKPLPPRDVDMEHEVLDLEKDLDIDIPRDIDINIPNHIKQEIDKKLESKVTEMKHEIQQKISNMQIDLIRQFMEQEGQIEGQLQGIAINNKKQKDVIEQLTDENQKLRGIQF